MLSTKIALIFIHHIDINLITLNPCEKTPLPNAASLRAAATSLATLGYAADKPLTITYSAQSPWQ
jgi:hypothetical protein